MQSAQSYHGTHSRGSTHASADASTGSTSGGGGRYVHCPYYIPTTSPLASGAVPAGPRDSGLQGFHPPRVGSLGTPRASGLWGAGQSPCGPVRGSLASTSSFASHPRTASSTVGLDYDTLTAAQVDAEVIVLLPTRPLLKALAKQCRPSPPWCVGYAPPADLGEEVLRFCDFNTPMEEELGTRQSCTATMESVVRRVWPEAALQPTGATAAGQNVTKGVTLHFYATGTTDATPEQLQQWMRAANEVGAQANFLQDDRGLPCAVVVDSRSGHRSCIRYGSEAAAALAHASHALESQIASKPVPRAVLNTLLALLNQNKLLDESGTARTLLSGEAVAVMLLAVINSYDETDVPDAGRVLLDFFLTYGFESYFNPLQSSVSVKGLAVPCPKRHLNAQLSVLDPSNETVNLTPEVDRVSSIQAVFNYCYTALSQYSQVSSSLHRAQSPISTIIGGEPYWVRVLRFYQLQVEPYYSVVQSKKHILAQCL